MTQPVEPFENYHLLEDGEIRITHRLVDASNATLLGEIADYGKVIYKPIAGERPLWDFPEGTLADREVAAYKFSSFLDLDLVPTTILREGPFGPGMVQRWIDVNEDYDVIAYGQSSADELRMLALFDAIINNTDRKYGHLLLDDSGHLYGCDHGVTFHAEDKLRTVIWQFAGEPFNDRESRTLDKALIQFHEISEILTPHLSAFELSALGQRLNQLSDTGVFPEPSENWPPVPWPPV